ncbi:hypothetical protein [Parasutterella sp.]|uniref:hypothetical protein n=1 Tax=Parasutterella sp. TaxID=2049037 RepID=UPI003522AB19
MAQTVEAKQVVLKDSEGGYLLPYAGVAQKALKDNDGNDIPTTYAKKADLNGYLPVDGKAVDSAKADTATSAASATKATQDSAGQQINTTYIKNVSVNGRTITFTRGNGTTFSITTQDTVTTNTSNWSVSNGTNGWARDNSTGFTIEWGTVNGTISQNPSANFARTLTLSHSAVVSKRSSSDNGLWLSKHYFD